MIVLGTLVLWLGSVTFLALRNVRAAKTAFNHAQDQLIAQDFTVAQTSVAQARVSLERTRRNLNGYWPLTVIPPTSTQMDFIRDAINSVSSVAQALDSVIAVADGIVTPVLGDDDLSLSSLTVDQKRQMLKGIYEAGPALPPPVTKFSITSLRSAERLNALWSPVVKDGTAGRASSDPTKLWQLSYLPQIISPRAISGKTFCTANNTELRPSGDSLNLWCSSG